MQLLSLHIPIVGLDIVLGTVVVAAYWQRQWVTFSAVAAMFNPLANLLAIPLAIEWFDNGAIGAAFHDCAHGVDPHDGSSLDPAQGCARSTDANFVAGRIVLAGASIGSGGAPPRDRTAICPDHSRGNDLLPWLRSS